MFFLFTVIAIPLFVCVEYIRIRRHHYANQQGGEGLSKDFGSRSIVLSCLLNCVYLGLALYVSNKTITTVAIVAKRTVSRLRPNFLATCQPDLSVLCPESNISHPVYVEDYVCRGAGYGFEGDQYAAFPSGHAGNCANFTVFMLVSVGKWDRVYTYAVCNYRSLSALPATAVSVPRATPPPASAADSTALAIHLPHTGQRQLPPARRRGCGRTDWAGCWAIPCKHADLSNHYVKTMMHYC